jgi:3-methyladenine DNA glycosylase AlkD
MNKNNAEKYHRELLSLTKAHRRRLSKSDMDRLRNYIGTNKICYAIGAEGEKRIVKEWINQHPDITSAEYAELLDRLYGGESINEISLAGSLLRRFSKLRKDICLENIDVWLNGLHGWAEVDSLCQSCFTAEEILANWECWRRLLVKLASDENVQKRRTSLVLLTKAVRDSDSRQLADLAFANVEKLKSNRDILITKAISWLLRDLIKHNRKRVEEYMRENEDTLPRIAVRETKTKLLTGRKTCQIEKARKRLSD